MIRISIVSLLLIAGVCSAEEPDPAYHGIAGVGGASCGKWIEGREMHEAAMDAMFSSWVQGFLSGVNSHRYVQTKQRMVAIPDAPTILAYVDKFCRDKPLEGVLAASLSLYGELNGK